MNQVSGCYLPLPIMVQKVHLKLLSRFKNPFNGLSAVACATIDVVLQRPGDVTTRGWS